MSNNISPSLEAMTALKAIAAANPPNWIRPLSDYKNGWAKKIAATIIASDNHGPTVVLWCGHFYIRRTGSKQYGTAIWFSRAAGKDESGDNNYLRLITFKEKAIPHAEPLPDYVISKLD